MADPKKLKLPIKLNLTTVLVAAVVLIVLGELLLGTGGFVEVEPGEVAVVYNNTGIPVFGDDEESKDRQFVNALARGLEILRGPTNPSTNEDCGLLVDGFDTPPMVMMPLDVLKLADSAGCQRRTINPVTTGSRLCCCPITPGFLSSNQDIVDSESA